MSVGHAHGLEDSLPRERVEALPGNPLDQLAQDHEADVGVDELRARRRGRLQLGDPLPGGFGAMLEVLQGIVRNQARPMAQEVLDRDRRLAVVIELGQELDDAVAQAKLALLDQEHGGGGRDDRLGQRGHVEDRVARHGFGGRFDGAQAGGASVGDLATSSHDHHGAGDLSFRDGAIDGRVKLLQSAGIESKLLGRGFGQGRLAACLGLVRGIVLNRDDSKV